MSAADDRMTVIIALQSALDDRRPERRRTGFAVLASLPVTLVLVAAGVVLGGYTWWFPGLWAPMWGVGVYRWLRMVGRDRRDTERLAELGFELKP